VKRQKSRSPNAAILAERDRVNARRIKRIKKVKQKKAERWTA
jgi:hypothetical protein